MRGYNYNRVANTKKKYDEKLDELLNKSNDDVQSTPKQLQEKEINPEIRTIKAPKSKRQIAKTVLACFVLILFFVAGAALIYVASVNLATQMSYKEVNAVVVKVRTYVSADDGILMGVPTFEYYVDGKKYTTEASSATNIENVPMVGDVVPIKYDPKNPSKIVSDSWTVILLFIMGPAFILISTPLFIQIVRGKIEIA